MEDQKGDVDVSHGNVDIARGNGVEFLQNHNGIVGIPQDFCDGVHNSMSYNPNVVVCEGFGVFSLQHYIDLGGLERFFLVEFLLEFSKGGRITDVCCQGIPLSYCGWYE